MVHPTSMWDITWNILPVCYWISGKHLVSVYTYFHYLLLVVKNALTSWSFSHPETFSEILVVIIFNVEKLTSYKQVEKCQQVKSIALVNLAQY